MFSVLHFADFAVEFLVKWIIHATPKSDESISCSPGSRTSVVACQVLAEAIVFSDRPLWYCSCLAVGWCYSRIVFLQIASVAGCHDNTMSLARCSCVFWVSVVSVISPKHAYLFPFNETLSWLDLILVIVWYFHKFDLLITFKIVYTISRLERTINI